MIVYMPNGDRLVQRWGSNTCTGYVAEKIEIDADDVEAMANMAAREPGTFQKVMAQFEHRFMSRRAGYVNPNACPRCGAKTYKFDSGYACTARDCNWKIHV